MQRLGVYLPSLDGGGAQRVILTLVNTMVERGVNVDLVLVRAEGPFLSHVHDAVRIVDLRVDHVAKSLPRLIQYLRRERPGALLSSLNYANIIALLACALARVDTRVVVSEHNTLSQSRPANLRDRVLPGLMRTMYPWADLVIAVSQGVGDDLCQAIGLERNKLRVIYNPVVRPEILVKAAEPLNHPWFQLGQPPVILGIGRLEAQKDFGNLIRAFWQLRKTRDARLLILGEGDLRLQLEGLVRELGLSGFVDMPGFVDNPYAYLSRAAVFALSSRWEGLPTVLIEAMACGTRVVATDCPSGPREILQGGVWGRLVPLGESVALATALAAALDDTEPPKVVERANLFGVELACDQYLAALKS